MKSIRSLLLLCGVALAASFYLVRAQQIDSSIQVAESVPENDTATMIQAIEMVAPTPAESLPQGGTFWSAQHAPGTRNAWPPLPGNMWGLSAWPLGDGQFLLNDTNLDYDALTAVIEAAQPVTASPMMRMSMMSSSLSTAYAYGNPIYLGNLTASFAYDGSETVNYSVYGGTNFVPWDIEMTTNLAAPNWTWQGIAYTSNSFVLYGQPSGLAFYRLVNPTKTMTVGIGGDIYCQSDVPSGLTNILMTAAGYGYSLGLLNGGTVVGWGNSGADGWVPTNLVGNVSMVAAAWDHNVALLTNGTVQAWGANIFGVLNVPSGLSNVVVISAESLHTLALCSNGTVVAWGYDSFGQCDVPYGLTNVTAIAAGGEHSLAVSGGYVVAWGDDWYGQCDVPTDLSNIWDVAASGYHSLALKGDGTVEAWGDNAYGECNVPAGLSNVVAIAAGGDYFVSDAYMGKPRPYSLALKSDGSVVAWGAGYVPNPVQGVGNVIFIGGGLFHALAVRTGPPTPAITLEPTNRFQAQGQTATFTARGAGLYGVTCQWQTNGVNLSGATNATLTLTNVQPGMDVPYSAVVTDNGYMGSLVSSNASLTIVPPPVIVSQSPMPTNQVGIYQSNLTLSVSASATAQTNGFPLSYQWQFNGTNISGATSSSYTFLVDTPTLGAYSVIAANAAGSVTSLVWQVSMTYVGSYIAPGTLAYHLSTNAVARTNGISDIYGGTMLLSGWNYASYTGTNLAFLTNAVWSTNFWLKGVQGLSATCIGFSNGLGGQGLASMVSPRHYLCATHMHPEGYLTAFLDTNKVIYWRTTLQRVDVGNDTSVGILNADLPSSVGCLQVLPTNFSNYLPANNTSFVQGIGMNQDMRMFSQPMTLGNPTIAWSSSVIVPFGLGTNWNTVLRGGDSSDPEVLLIKNQFVLVTHNFFEDQTSRTGGGPNYAYQMDAINQQMHYLSTNNAVGTDYQLSQFSLTNWPTIH